MKPETRISTDLRIEQRAGSNAPRITGYAAVFNSETTIAGQFREVIQPGAFKRALAEAQDCIACVNHNPDRIIGRTKSGTLELREDNNGLWFSVEPPDTQEGRDLVTLMKRGDLSGTSFAFRATKDGETWEQKGSALPLRTLTDVDLFDVSIVTNGAYPDAGAALRSMATVINDAIKTSIEAKLAERLAKLNKNS